MDSVTPWEEILPPETNDMLFGVVNGDDIVKLVAAIGVVLVLLKQFADSRKLTDKHDDTQAILQALLGMLAQNRRVTDPKLPSTLIINPPSAETIPPPPPPPPVETQTIVTRTQ